MSNYENYTNVSLNYDATRIPSAAPTYIRELPRMCGKPISDIHVLDAGCGTGNYSLELLRSGIGKVTLLDANVDMLEKAKNKLDSYLKDGRIGGFIEATLPDIPVDDSTIDAVLFNFVLHHVEVPGSGHAITRETLFSVAKRLGSVKAIGVQTLVAEQYRGNSLSAWYLLFFPERVLQIFDERLPPFATFQDIFLEAGFSSVTKIPVFQSIICEDNLNYNEVKDKRFRSTLSGFSMFDVSEEDVYVKRLEEAMSSGEWESLVANCMENRRNIGDSVVILAERH